jgi:LysM repeat protein
MRPAFLRKHLPIALAILTVSTSLFFSRGLGFVSAQAPYSVKAGDTLLSIAIELGVSDSRLSGWMDEVVRLNSLPSADSLAIGQKLTLPESNGGGPNSTAPSAVTADASSGSYIVKAGDTLYDIASKNGVPAAGLDAWLAAIRQLNDLSSTDLIAEGNSLRLPKVTGGAPASRAGASSVIPRVDTTTTTSYTVRPGDTLHDIANRNGIAEATLTAWIEAVLKLNSLGSADLLQEGGVLKIPGRGGTSSTAGSATTTAVTYKVASGDTLYGIAAAHGAENIATWVETVLSLNDLESADLLQEGMTLKVPGKPASAEAPVSGSSTASAAPVATTEYIVKSGDTLYDIAASNGVSEPLGAWIEQVLKLNSLESANMLREGAVLKVPGLPGRRVPEAASGPNTVSTPPASSTYTVKGGETLPGIARKLGIPEDVMSLWIDQVAMLSRINRNDPLVDGEILLVPAAPTPRASQNAATASTSDPSKPSRSKPTTSYTVKAGDTLSDIASRFKVGTTQLSSWFKDVLEMNSLSSADMIAVGQKLVVPGEETASQSQANASPAASAAPPALPSAAGPTSTQAAPSLTRGSNGTCYYMVVPGDTWDIVARKLGVADNAKAAWIDGISALNGITGKPLPIGDQIRMLC